MRPLSVRLSLALLLLAACVAACVPPAGAEVEAPVRAPSWEQVAFEGVDADFVAAFDLEAIRADPLFGPLVARAARDRLGVLQRASQIDVVGTAERGRPSSWVVVVHGVTGPPSRRDVGSDADRFVVASSGGAWLYGEGPAFERIRANPDLASSPVDMPAGALVTATALGRAIPRPRHPELVDLSEGLHDVTVVLMGGAHLGFALSCRYEDAAAARRAGALMRLALASAAARDDDFSALARALMKVDFDVSDGVVSMRVTISDDLRDALQHYIRRAMAAEE